MIATVSGTATVNAGGVYSVTVTNPINGCINTATATVASNLTAQAPTVALISSTSSVCQGSTVLVSANVGGLITGYQWYKNGVAVPGQTSASLSLGAVDPTQEGSYVLVITSGCGSFTSTAFTLTVKPSPVVTLSLINGGAVLQATGGVLYERMMVIDRINGYEIRQTDSSTTGFFTITRTGPYRLVVTGANGCQTVVESSIASLPR